MVLDALVNPIRLLVVIGAVTEGVRDDLPLLSRHGDGDMEIGLRLARFAITVLVGCVLVITHRRPNLARM